MDLVLFSPLFFLWACKRGGLAASGAAVQRGGAPLVLPIAGSLSVYVPLFERVQQWDAQRSLNIPPSVLFPGNKTRFPTASVA